MVLRLVVAGIAKREIAQAAGAAGSDKVTVSVVSDMEGAKAVKQGNADYFIGSCASGQGGALSIAIAILGYGNCCMLSTAGAAPKPEEVKKKVFSKDYKAYGINGEHAKVVIPPLVDALLTKHHLK